MPVSHDALAQLSHFDSFKTRVRALNLKRTTLETLQVNVGKLCNQACHHCHVEAGPKRTEIMTAQTARRVIELLEAAPAIHTVDFTGGAPELNPSFRLLVEKITAMGKRVIDRCNLTVFEEKDQQDTPEFLAKHRVVVVASLPCYSESNVDKQRGHGVFAKSIRALKRLNALGYGAEHSGLHLDLVYNPVGYFLPPPQEKLEQEYKTRLKNDFGIEFNRLYCITNMPIKRFLEDLLRNKKLDEYMNLLVNSFNPVAAEAIMCRNLLSIGWDGKIFDCDFNQMLEIEVEKKPKTIWDLKTLNSFDSGEVSFYNHCYGCTAGSGSSCGGSTKE